MGVIAVNENDEVIEDITPAISNEFMVYSRRSRPNGKRRNLLEVLKVYGLLHYIKKRTKKICFVNI